MNNSWEPQQHTNVTVNINKYIAKYDYDIAQYVCPNTIRRKNEDMREFDLQAIYEVLELCSAKITAASRVFQSLWTLDGKCVTCLLDLPSECQMLVASERPMPLGEKRLALKKQETFGFRDNTYVVRNVQDFLEVSTRQIAHKYTFAKEAWCERNFANWASGNGGKIEPFNVACESKI